MQSRPYPSGSSAPASFSNVLFLFLGRGQVIDLLIVALRGFPIGLKFIAESILSDIIDYDQFLTGQRNAATLFLFRSFLPKIVQFPARRPYCPPRRYVLQVTDRWRRAAAGRRRWQ